MSLYLLLCKLPQRFRAVSLHLDFAPVKDHASFTKVLSCNNIALSVFLVLVVVRGRL